MLDFVFFMSAPFLSLRPELPTRGHRVDGSGVGIVLYDTDFEHRPVACRTDDHEHLAAIERADKVVYRVEDVGIGDAMLPGARRDPHECNLSCRDDVAATKVAVGHPPEEHVSSLSDAVLPLIRTRADVWRWSTANAHGRQMHEAVDMLEAAFPDTDPAEAYVVTHKALASAVKVIARADDSSGVIGDACRRLLDLHPKVAASARVPTAKLVDWMIAFQFDGDVDYFELDPVAYAPALGDIGMKAYRARLDAVAAGLDPDSSADMRWTSTHSHEWSVLDWNAQRLAVLDHDIEAIIRTHARDRRVAAWLQDTAEAFEEIGEIDLAIDWAKQATDFDHGHQSMTAARYWCRLLDQHRPDDALEARLSAFRRWPSAVTATGLHEAAGSSWPDLRDEVMATLTASPGDAVRFTQLVLKDVEGAWQLAHDLAMEDDSTWTELAHAYEKVDPTAVLPIHRRLVEHELVDADAQHYRRAARRLALMRRLAAGTDASVEVDDLVAELRQVHRRRPRLQQEFDRAGLP
jgi:hypothetical protein